MSRRIALATTLCLLGMGGAILPGCDQDPALTGTQTTLQPDQDKTVVLQGKQTGALKVTLKGDFVAQATRQATYSDISSVRIGVEATGADAQSRTLTSGELAAGGTSASATFETLPVGVATVSVSALDVSGALVGSAEATASVAAGVTSTLNLSLELGTISYTPHTGDLSTEVTITEPVPYYTVSTFAGNGTMGKVDGTGTAAMLAEPFGLAFDASGVLFVADGGDFRRITPDAAVTTWANSIHMGRGIAVDASGVPFVASAFHHLIRKVPAQYDVENVAGGPGSGGSNAGFADGTGRASMFNYPLGLAFDGGNNLYVADSKNHRIRKMTPATEVSTIAGSGTAGGFNGTGTAAQFNEPSGLALDGAGNLYIAEAKGYRVRKMSLATGVVTTLAGSGTAGFADGRGTSAQFRALGGLAVDADGYVYVADYGNHRIRRISPTGSVVTLAGDGTAGFVDGIRTNSRFNGPWGIVLDASGSIFVADSENRRIRKLTL